MRKIEKRKGGRDGREQREITCEFEAYKRGIVFVGSPHQGAKEDGGQYQNNKNNVTKNMAILHTELLGVTSCQVHRQSTTSPARNLNTNGALANLGKSRAKLVRATVRTGDSLSQDLHSKSK